MHSHTESAIYQSGRSRGIDGFNTAIMPIPDHQFLVDMLSSRRSGPCVRTSLSPPLNGKLVAAAARHERRQGPRVLTFAGYSKRDNSAHPKIASTALPSHTFTDRP